MMWYYKSEEIEIGPFDRTVLGRMRDASIIDDATLVRISNEDGWISFGELVRQEQQPSSSILPTQISNYYYLNAHRQPVGPFSLETLSRLYREGVIAAGTFVARKGEAQWTPVSQLIGITAPPSLSVRSDPMPEVSGPKFRSFEQFALLMGVTLGLFTLYVVPIYSRDIKAITGRERMEFTPLLIFGILTLGILLIVMMILWAYDLERYGRERDKRGRLESLGTYVLILNIVSVVISLMSGGLAFVVSLLLGVWAVWLLQKEINLYSRQS